MNKIEDLLNQILFYDITPRPKFVGVRTARHFVNAYQVVVEFEVENKWFTASGSSVTKALETALVKIKTMSNRKHHE